MGRDSDEGREFQFSGFGSISPFTGKNIVIPDRGEVLALVREYNSKVGNGVSYYSLLDYLGIDSENTVYKKRLSSLLSSLIKKGVLRAGKGKGRGEFSPGHNYYYDPGILDSKDVYMRGAYSVYDFIEEADKERKLFGR